MDSSGPERQMTSPVSIVLLLLQQTVPRTSFHISFVEIAAAFQVVLRASPPQSQISCATNEETPSPISRPTPKNAAASALCAANECATHWFCARHGRASTVSPALLVLFLFPLPCSVSQKHAIAVYETLVASMQTHTYRTVFSQSTLQSPSM